MRPRMPGGRAGQRIALLLPAAVLSLAALAQSPDALAQSPDATPLTPPLLPTAKPIQVDPTARPSSDPTVRERELLERIRELKMPRTRSYGACRYDWGAWRLNEKGVRSTSSDCGDPPIRGTVAVHCDTLLINRRVQEGPWEGWRLPYTAEESPLLGGEDRLVAALCANVRGAGGRGQGSAPPSLTAPPRLTVPAPKPPAPARPRKPALPAAP